ncbi:hypothetical protein VTN49DRAFT_5395 [Thermomyces lanuginosus]|uniref:uncharacterized protein n=1 Tax=Thermomyces lanuginosus TaxID=5541 RepID=UPI0037435C54
MRIRYPFLGAFVVLLLFSASLGLLPQGSTIPENLQPNDKFLHLFMFFLLSIAFYWIPDTSRRRALQISLIAITCVLGVGSEILQALLPNGRSFDVFDVIANLIGSLGGIGLCGWYHRRMLERRRKARLGALAEDSAAQQDDIELGLNQNGMSPQETGVTTLEHEVDNWDENAEDSWDDDGPGPSQESSPAKHRSGTDQESSNPPPSKVKTRSD